MESSSGIYEAVKEIAQARARKLKAIRELLENGEIDSALALTRELVGLPRSGETHSIPCSGK